MDIKSPNCAGCAGSTIEVKLADRKSTRYEGGYGNDRGGGGGGGGGGGFAPPSRGGGGGGGYGRRGSFYVHCNSRTYIFDMLYTNHLMGAGRHTVHLGSNSFVKCISLTHISVHR